MVNKLCEIDANQVIIDFFRRCEDFLQENNFNECEKKYFFMYSSKIYSFLYKLQYTSLKNKYFVSPIKDLINDHHFSILRCSLMHFIFYNYYYFTILLPPTGTLAVRRIMCHKLNVIFGLTVNQIALNNGLKKKLHLNFEI